MEQQKQYLDSKITPLLKPMLVELFISKPSDPMTFMINYLEGIQKGTSPSKKSLKKSSKKLNKKALL